MSDFVTPLTAAWTGFPVVSQNFLKLVSTELMLQSFIVCLLLEVFNSTRIHFVMVWHRGQYFCPITTHLSQHHWLQVTFLSAFPRGLYIHSGHMCIDVGSRLPLLSHWCICVSPRQYYTVFIIKEVVKLIEQFFPPCFSRAYVTIFGHLL